jgi:hypothetical protein
VADAKSALRRAQAGHEKLQRQQLAAEAHLKQLEAKSAEIQRGIAAAKASFASDVEQLGAWAGTLAFATADLSLAERALDVAEAESRLARFKLEHPDGGPASERKALEQAVASAAERLGKEKSGLEYNELSKQAEKAAATLEKIRSSEANRHRLVAIEMKLTQLSAVATRKDQERKALTAKQDKSAQDLAGLDSERKKLEAEHKRLASKS